MMTPVLRPAAILTLSVAALLSTPTRSAAQEYFDDMNGVWTVTLNGQAQTETALTECYSPGGSAVTLRFKDKGYNLSRNGNKLVAGGAGSGFTGNLHGGNSATASDVDLTTTGLDTFTTTDDKIEGKFFGQTMVMKRDTRAKPPIELKLPGDRPWVSFMREILIPKTAEDRETYHTFRPDRAREFLRSCQLYQTHYWQRKYFAGETNGERNASFDALVNGMNNMRVSPRSISSSRFGSILRQNLSESAQDSFALAKSSLGMYFSTAAGGAVRIIVTDNRDSIVYYITDRRANSRNGLVVMLTPTHPPLASSFGKWLLDFSLMEKQDDATFTRCLLETMVKSSTASANKLVSGHGKSAFTDYLGVMAIEDQRGVMFGNDGLSWGYNMTSGSFTALISRALSHGQMRKGPDLVEILGDTPKNRALARQIGFTGQQELASQVIVEDWSGSGPKLQPGDASYFDTLNGADNVLAGEGTKGGNDFQEGQGMATLRRLTTKWLRAKYPQLVKAAEDSVSMFIPKNELSSDSQEDVFHLLCENFFDNARFSKVTAAQGDKIIAAGAALMDKIHAESRDLEKFILENGVTKSNDWAPRASGF